MKSTNEFTFNPSKNTDMDGVESERTNGKRAEDSDHCLHRYKRHCLGESGPLDEECARDLVADIGHLCDRNGWDFQAVLRMAQSNWEEER